MRKRAIPKNTRKITSWARTVWIDWTEYRQSIANVDADDSELPSFLINQMTKTELNDWLSHFVVEVGRRDGELYPPNTLYQICCGLQRAIRETKPDWNLFAQPEFSDYDYYNNLDAQLKDSRTKGLGNNKRQAEPITAEEENIMWASGVLGTHSPQALVDTLFFLIGMCFGLRGGQEHRQL